MARLATVAAFGFDDFHPPQILDLYRRLGCTRCQFYRNEDNPPTVADARRITDEAGVPIDSMHGVFGDRYDPSNPDESIRAKAVEVYKREGELALELGGPMVVVHPSAPAPDGFMVSRKQRQQRVDPLRRSMSELAEFGQAHGVVYLWENNPHNHFMGNDPLQLADLLRELDSPHARMCYDTGHAMMTGPVAKRLIACADVIGYLHIHDNDGRVDDHRMPGDGEIDWNAVRDALAKTQLDVSAMLEVFYLADRLEELTRTDLPGKLAQWMNTAATPAA